MRSSCGSCPSYLLGPETRTLPSAAATGSSSIAIAGPEAAFTRLADAGDAGAAAESSARSCSCKGG